MAAVRATWSLLGIAILGAGACQLVAGLEDGELRPDGGGATGGSVSGGGGAGNQAGGAGNTGGDGTAGSGNTGGGVAGGGVGGGVAGGGVGGGGGAGGASCTLDATGMVEISMTDPFMMGCNHGVDAQCSSDEDPAHEVTLSPYRIDAYEVSRGDYKECVDAGQCDEPPCDWDPSGAALQDHPVTCVTWDDAVAYCEWRCKRLPTEAEWEYAARGNTGMPFPWGLAFNDDCSLANINWCREDTVPVTSLPTGGSPWGCFNMAGNVAEWVSDIYGQSYYTTSPSTDPTGPAQGATRVLRGGHWFAAVFNCRTSARDAQVATFNDDKTGFRCAADL